jgi:hypothetical protein
MLRSAVAAAKARRGALGKIIYLAAVATLLFMGLERRFALPIVPLLDLDSPNYLWPGLLKLNGEGFIHNAGLNFLYPGLLLVLLRVFSDFRSIVIFQHLLGVTAGLFFLLAWNRLGALDHASFLRRPVHAAIGLFGAGIYLLSPIPIMFELQIRPEALCMFGQMLSFWLILQVIFYRRASASPGRTVAYGIAGVASASLLYSLKPSYAVTSLLTIAFLLWLVLRAKLSWKFRSFFLFGALMTTLLFFVPERLLSHGDRVTKLFLPQTLFSIHADIIRDQIADDLAQGAAVPFPRPWLQTASQELGAEISRLKIPAPGQFSILGFDPDHLMNGEHAIFNRWLEQLGSDEEYERFLSYYYWRALEHRPFSFAKKIARQMGVFYAWECPAFVTYRRILLVAWHYSYSLSVITDAENWAQIGKTAAGGRLLSQTEAVLRREIVFNSGKRLFFYHTLLARAYLPALLVSVGLALWVILLGKWQPDSRWPTLLVIFFFLSSFGNVLAISAVHSMEVLRYSTVQFAAALFAELWAIRYVLDFALRLRLGSASQKL